MARHGPYFRLMCRLHISQPTIRHIIRDLELKPVITFRYELLSDHNNWK